MFYLDILTEIKTFFIPTKNVYKTYRAPDSTKGLVSSDYTRQKIGLRTALTGYIDCAIASLVFNHNL